MFGRTIKGLTADDIVNWDVGQDCFVEVIMGEKSKSIVVRRWRLDSERGNDVEIELGGKPFIGRQIDVQKVINETLRTDFSTFVNSILFSQGPVKYLAEQTDRTQRELFKKFLNLSEYDKAAQAAEKVLDRLQQESDHIRATSDHLQDKRSLLLETLEAARERRKEYDQGREGKIRVVENQIREIRESGPTQPSLETIDENYIEKLHTIITSKIDAQTETKVGIAHIEERIRIWSEHREGLQSLEGICPMCQQPINQDTVGRHIEEFEDRIRTESNRVGQLRDTIGSLGKEIQRLTEEKDRLDRVVEGNEDNIRRYERARQEYDNSKTKLEIELSQLKEPDNPYKESVEELKNQLAKIPNLSKLDEKLKELEEECVYTEFVQNLFKPRGIQSYVIEQSFDFLNQRVNEYLVSITEGELSMQFEPMRQLKTGEYKEEITLKFVKKGRDVKYENLTDAERVCTNISIIFALHDFGNFRGISHFDFIFLDEVLDISLDEIRQEALVDLLYKVAQYTPSVFVISHREQLKASIPNVLTVTIQNGESEVHDGT